MIWDESLEITRFEILFSIRKEDLTESIGRRETFERYSNRVQDKNGERDEIG